MGNCQVPPADINKSELSKSKSKSQLQIKTFTWTRDSHGLYDYEGKNQSKKSLKTSRSGILTRNGNDIHLLKENEKHKPSEDKSLFKVAMRDGHFWVSSCHERDGSNCEENSEGFDEGLWLVVKSIKMNSNKGFPLSEGDLVKLGRIKFRVKEIQASPNNDSQKPVKTEVENDNDQSIDNSMMKSRDSIKASTLASAQVCRICLSESNKPGNPFFSPCLCSGTMKYVHIKCLQKWLKSKLHTKDSGQCISIYWKTLECELCKTGYPNSFVVNDQKYDIVEIERPNCAYLMLEVLSKDKNMAKGIHIIKMENKNNIRLGRGHDSDIRITDISVSRCHALIKLEKGKFYLEDNNSKFGTLVNIRRSFCVAGVFNNISLQAGRTLITINIRKNKSLFPICFSHTAHDDSSNDIEEIHSDNEDRIETEHNIPNSLPHNLNENRISNIPRPSGDNFDDNLFIENLEDHIPVEGHEENPETIRANNPQI